MPFFTAGQLVPVHDFTPLTLVMEEAWGEIWRAQKDGMPVLLVAYTTPEGQDLFEEAAAKLAHWKTCSEGTVVPHLLRILEISDGAIPYLLVQDPGGPTLREHIAALPDPMPLADQGRMALHVSKAVAEAEVYSFTPVGLTPDTIFSCPTDRDAPWRLLPVAPATRGQLSLLGGGAWFPKEAREAANPGTTNSDCFSLAWLWSDVWRRDFNTARSDPKEGIPYKGLTFLMDICLEMRNGVYTDPNTVNASVDRWLRKTMAEDLRDEEEKERIRRRGPVGNFLYNSRGFFKVAAITILVVGGVGGVLYALYNSELFKPALNRQKSEDMARMFLTAVIAGESEEAQTFLAGSSVDETAALAEWVQAMEEQGTIAEWNAFTASVITENERTFAYVTLIDSRRQPFAAVTMRLQQRNNFEWYVANVFLRPLKYGDASSS